MEFGFADTRLKKSGLNTAIESRAIQKKLKKEDRLQYILRRRREIEQAYASGVIDTKHYFPRLPLVFETPQWIHPANCMQLVVRGDSHTTLPSNWPTRLSKVFKVKDIISSRKRFKKYTIPREVDNAW